MRTGSFIGFLRIIVSQADYFTVLLITVCTSIRPDRSDWRSLTHTRFAVITSLMPMAGFRWHVIDCRRPPGNSIHQLDAEAILD